MSGQKPYDIAISVDMRFLDDQSAPGENRYAFAYTITIANHGSVGARLLSRHWIITDANGKVHEVRGDGVVGEPWMRPAAIEYTWGGHRNRTRHDARQLPDGRRRRHAVRRDDPDVRADHAADAALMATWAIGDVQGCHDELTRLIDKLRFDPANDTLWFCGDLVNRGGQSLAVLRTIKSLGDRAIVALGNHDLSLLAVSERKREDQARVNPELREVLFAPDRDELIGWLRTRKLVHVDRGLGYLLVHAGLFPRWTSRPRKWRAKSKTSCMATAIAACSSRCSATSPICGHRSCAVSTAGAPASTCSRACASPTCAAASPSPTRARRARSGPGCIRGSKFRPCQTRPQGRLRPLVDARPLRGPRRACDRHRLRLGRLADRNAARRGRTEYVTIKSDRKPAPGKEMD
jgi:hypothetical protein